MAVILTPIAEPGTVCSAEILDIFDANCDWRVYDGFSAITFNSRTPGVDSISINNSLFRFTTDKEAQVSNGVYIRYTGTYFIPSEYMPSSVFPGDYITDNNGDNWVIQAIDRPPHYGTQWQLLVNSLRFNLPLTNSIDYYTVEAITDEYGGKTLNKELTDENLVCAIQPIMNEDETKASRIYKNTEYNVYLEEDVVARIGDVIKDNNNNWYEVLTVNNRERIDEFTLLIVKEIIHSDELN